MAKAAPDREVQDALEEAIWLQKATEYILELEKRFELKSEVVVAVNWSKGQAQFLEVKDRQYPDLGPGWMYGTMDLLGFSHDMPDTMYVGDWKTGGTDGANEQLLSLLAASRKAFHKEHGHLPTKYIISCLLVTEDGIWPHEREVSAEELDAHWQAMEWQSEKIGKEYKPTPGIHCVTLYCPHLSYCTAIGDVLDDLAEQDDKIRAEYLVRRNRISGEPKDAKEAAYTMERISAAKRQLNYLTECMKEYVNNGGQIISGQWQWSKGKDGFRWRKN